MTKISKINLYADAASLADQGSGSIDSPLISICCITYNHEKFISECLDSFLNQKISFHAEILIHDDASTDKTASIIQGYEKQFPNIVKPIYQVENQFKKNIKLNIAFNYPRARGKYIAFCEGDDYWTDPLKLQKQVDFLENNPEYMFCWTRFKTLDENTKQIVPDQNGRYFASGKDGVDVGYPEFLKGWHIGTQTIVFRTEEIFKNNNFSNPSYRDIFLIADLLNLGKGYCLSDFTAIYRVHENGICSGAHPLKKAQIGADIYREIYKVYPNNIYLKLKYKKFNKIYINALLSNGLCSKALDVLHEEVSLLASSCCLDDMFKTRVSDILSYYHCELNEKRDAVQGWAFKIGRWITCPYRTIRAIKSSIGAKRKLRKDGVGFIDKNKILESFKRECPSILSSEERSPRLIVSLTSFPERIPKIFYTLYSLLSQTLKPDLLVLWLAESQFPHKENDLPEQIRNLTNNGLIIKWCDDFKSYKKLIPSLQYFPNDIIVTADDDIFYANNWLKSLYDSYLEDPLKIHCHRAHRVKLSADNRLTDYYSWEFGVNTSGASFLNFQTGAGGVLYPPNSLYKDVTDESIFMELSPTADDIWFWMMAVLAGTKINVVKDNISELQPVDPELEYGYKSGFKLLNVNRTKNDLYLQELINFYGGSTFLDRLRSDS
jgi:glycosyltransferase involved in cell wall biosynthesis